MPERQPTDPYMGALLGLACGDALGAPVEHLEKADLEARHGRLTEMVGGGSFGWAPGEWTDDTGMALCVAEGILARPEDPVDKVGERFLEWQKTAKDVGGTISAALGQAAGDPIDWVRASQTTHQAKSGLAAGNGSLMRTLPVALAYPDERKMLDVSSRVSAMTHWDPQAEICCAIYCLWVREILYGADPRPAWQTALRLGREVAAEGRRSTDTPGPTPLPDLLWLRLEGASDRKLEDLQPNGYAGYVLDCLEAAVWVTVNTDSLEDALVTLVNLGGETDTMAAVAGGAVGARFGLQAIPDRWLEVLHQRERLEQAGQGLFELRHDQVYDKPTLPKLDIKKLDGGLLYGRNPLTARDVQVLIDEGVTRILDLREDHEWSRANWHGREAVATIGWCGMVRDAVPIVDGDTPGTNDLDRTWQILSEGLAKGPVYVHCRAGIERTGAVITAYLARRDGRTLDDTLRRLNEANAGLHPLPHQVEAVQRWLEQVGSQPPGM